MHRIRVVWPKINRRQDTIKIIYNVSPRSHLVVYRDDHNSTIDLQSMKLEECFSRTPPSFTEIETPTRTKPSRKLAVEIRHRFQRAEDFFRRRIADIDHILQKKDELKINDTVFLEMLEKNIHSYQTRKRTYDMY